MNSASASSRNLPPRCLAQNHSPYVWARAGVCYFFSGRRGRCQKRLIPAVKPAMDTKDNKIPGEQKAVRGMIDWAIMGLPSTLAETVNTALVSITTTGDCRNADQDWALFGEVVEVRDGPPFCAQLRRVSLLSPKADHVGAQWAKFDLVCPTGHNRVDFSPGMLLGVYTKPANRQGINKAVADASGIFLPLTGVLRGMLPIFSLEHMRVG